MVQNLNVMLRAIIFGTVYSCFLQASASQIENHIEDERGAVTVEHAEIVLSPTMTGVAAGYLVVSNDTMEEVGLNAVRAMAFDRVSLHKTELQDGVARMRPIGGVLRIPQRSELVMQPGGIHLMLTGPIGKLVAGGKVPLVVDFTDGSTQTVDAVLLPAGKIPTDHHHGEDVDGAKR